MSELTKALQLLDWRQPWAWHRNAQQVLFACAGVVGALLLSPWVLSSWQTWDEANQAHAKRLAQQQATQELRVQTVQLLQASAQTPIKFAGPQVLTQLAQQHGLHFAQLGSDKPQSSASLDALHIQQLPVHLNVQGSWDGWLKWLAQWPSAAPGVTMTSLELKADPRGGISAQVLAMTPQSNETDASFELAGVDSQAVASKSATATDPFSSQSWASAQRTHAAQHPSYTRLVAPELLRPRDVLETFARERLQYVGHMASGADVDALIKVLPPAGAAKDAQMMSVYRVRVGSRLGQNFGKVVAVHPDVLLVQELAVMPTGEWQTRDVRLPLLEAMP